MDFPQLPTAPPTGPTGFSPKPSPNTNLIFIALTAVFGIAAATFALLCVLAFNQANAAKTTLEQQKQAAATAARDEQKKTDQHEAEIAAESPYRSYLAPIEYGSFEIKFPKNWSSSVVQDRSSNTQVTLIVQPDFIRRDNGTDDLLAAKVQLIQKTLDEFLHAYDGQKTVVRTDVTVSGIKGVQLTGKFNDKRLTRVIVIPIRDKTLVFTNEASQYSSQFDQILAQSKIVP